MSFTILSILLATCLGANTGGKVYAGKIKGAKKPAIIEAKKVFNEIDEYKKIIEKGLTPDDPEYYTLLAAANRKFYAAVERVAGTGKYDCIAEEGTVKFGKKAPNVTDDVIKSLKSP